MNEQDFVPAEKSRKKFQSILRKKGYKITPIKHIGSSSQYWIIYCADKENEESRFKKGNWGLI